MLIAINKGVDILTIDWLTDSTRARKLLPIDNYTLKDEEMEKRLNFSVAEVLTRVKRETRGVFYGLNFYLSKGVIPTHEEMQAIIETGGGNVIPSPSKTAINIFNESTEKTTITQSKKQGFTLCKADQVLDAVVSRRFELINL